MSQYYSRYEWNGWLYGNGWKYFDCPESLEEYFGFTPNVDDNTGEILETIREYYDRGGEFTNVPDKYPCVIYFPIDDIDIRKKLEWIYIGKE